MTIIEEQIEKVAESSVTEAKELSDATEEHPKNIGESDANTASSNEEPEAKELSDPTEEHPKNIGESDANTTSSNEEPEAKELVDSTEEHPENIEESDTNTSSSSEEPEAFAQKHTCKIVCNVEGNDETFYLTTLPRFAILSGNLWKPLDPKFYIKRIFEEQESTSDHGYNGWIVFDRTTKAILCSVDTEGNEQEIITFDPKP